MNRFQDVSTGILFRNPVPHLRSLHAYFPSVVCLGGDELLASYVAGEAFEAIGNRVFLTRSSDGGRTWNVEGHLPAFDDGDRPMSESARLTGCSQDRVIGLVQHHDRSEHPDEGLTNPENLGFVPTEFAMVTSTDGGRAWNRPHMVVPPLEGPCFELCCPITVLSDGRWLLPTSTWRSWDGALPDGHRMVAFVSHDEGQTWPEYWDIMHHDSRPIAYWESKIVEMPDGRLLATAWGHDLRQNSDLPNQFSVSFDGGAHWTPPASTGLFGQTLTPVAFDADRVLCVYRRIDVPGLWLQTARLQADSWNSEDSAPLWGHDAPGLISRESSMARQFQKLRFGAPCFVRLADASFFLSFWCYEECVGLIRWYRFHLRD